ncbi:MAG TPA: hypothetical protein VH596_09200 [Terriglobales bacterium]|jgi:hypothetical protein
MKLQIDNFDGADPRDYTADIDATRPSHLMRKLNEASQFNFSLLSTGAEFIVPVSGARVTFSRANDQKIFTGYITSAPECEYLGWGERGAIYRYNFIAKSDEVLLDEKRLSVRSAFVARSAGDAVRELTEDAMPGAFDLSGVSDLDIVAEYSPDPQESWSTHVARIATEARASYRVLDGAIVFAPVGVSAYMLNEADATFSPPSLALQPGNAVVNDVTVLGYVEPQAYISDYFVGDGLTTRFYLSQTPFTRNSRTIFNEEYTTPTLDTTRWIVADPNHAVVAGNGKLQIAGGNGVDGATTVAFVEKVELGGSCVLEHGDIAFTSALSSGILGGLYLGPIVAANCLAGFQISPAGSTSEIQALINGTLAGSALSTVTGHHYVLTTRIFSQEIYRQQQIFHSATNPAGNGLGGAQVSANARVVLEVHDIDPANPATMVAPGAVLYDGVISSAPAFCTYALVNSTNLFCALTFTRLIRTIDVEVRTALPGGPYVTRLVGPLSSGCECNVVGSTTLDFFSEFAPAPNQFIQVRYRGQHGDALLLTSGRSVTRVTNPASIAAQKHGIDDGVRSDVRHLKLPPARTSADCENAALAMLANNVTAGWSGKYEVWSDFLPGEAQDIFPGDALDVNIPSRGATFQAIIRGVEITFADLAGEHSWYAITFANDAAENLSFQFETANVSAALNVPAIADSQVGSTTLPALTSARFTEVTSTTSTIDAGVPAIAGGGFEVRWSDAGWGEFNDENLAGRFTTQTFTLPRLSRAENYFLRQFDGSNPRKYSQCTTALHVDFPLGTADFTDS